MHPRQTREARKARDERDPDRPDALRGEGSRFARGRPASILLALALGSVAAGLIFALAYRELFGRVDAPFVPPTVDAELRAERMQKLVAQAERQYRIKSPIYHHDLARNKSIDAARWGVGKYRLRTNSLGFKDREVRDVPLRSDAHRILFMGDSFTEGVGLEYAKTFVGIIDDELATEGIEVLNGAVSSYSPAIYRRKVRYLIETVGLEFDEVVVFIDISDAQNDGETYYVDDDGIVRKNAATPDQAETFDITTRRYGDGRRRGLWTVDAAAFEKYGRIGLEHMSENMSALHALLQEHGIALTVAIYPWPEQVLAGDLESIQVTHWRAWCEQRDIPLVDYFPVFIRGQSRRQHEKMLERFYMPGDVHWTEKGHERVAEIFLENYHERRRGAATRDVAEEVAKEAS
ncbi:MAG: SGNH/GDSL hydrolase family protein [Deltaproteobacteria bacterium]|nr:SGNH/GDSL hydrolase family protein [Deltaproteobacteria bacterium]MBW2416916.1 SGNH/GDSL hydrolase family protein [Deltaproteobacteria bacterium]